MTRVGLERSKVRSKIEIFLFREFLFSEHLGSESGCVKVPETGRHSPLENQTA